MAHSNPPPPEINQPVELKPGVEQSSIVNQPTNIDDTRPTRIRSSVETTSTKSPRNKNKSWVVWILLFIIFMLLGGTTGALHGYQTAQQTLIAGRTAQVNLDLQDQYQLALQDLEAGQFDIARQRLDYILLHDPNFPGATDTLSQVLAVLYATSTPTPLPPAATATSPPPTPDLRPFEEQLLSAKNLVDLQEWSKAIESLLALRQSDPAYQTSRVDGLLWVSLRSRGVQKIYQEANLEGGIYDLALAERFGVIDIEAAVARNMARLYLYGLAFWEVYPQQAVYYFEQVASAMPNLRDSSGWTARQRYHSALIQYGDQLYSQKQWCDAQRQYELAWEIAESQDLANKLRAAIQQCLGYTATPTETATVTQTAPAEVTVTLTFTPVILENTPTPTATLPAVPISSNTPTPTATITHTPEPQIPTDTQSLPPSQTNTEAPADTAAPQPLIKSDQSTGGNNPTGKLIALLPLVALPFLLAVYRPPSTPKIGGDIKKGTNFPGKDNQHKMKPACTTSAIILAIVLILSAGLSAWAASIITRQIAQHWQGELFSNEFSLVKGTASPSVSLDAEQTPVDIESTPTLVEITSSIKPWNGAERVTALILGVDYRDWSANEPASRSDTMILLTLDPQSKTAGMISIPRDLWVNIPGFKHGKINTAYYLGDIYKLPGGGPALAIKTVEHFLGVDINYFAQIDFEAFVRFIDEIGGVTVDVTETITIDLLGTGFKTKKTLQPGRQVLPGEWALAYARARHTEGGDFDRADRQQQVIMAIRERMLDPNMLPEILKRAPKIYSEITSGIRSNLTLEQVIQLALLAVTLPDERISRGIIGKESVLFGQSPDGLAILIPVPDKIHLVRDRVFASSSSLGPLAAGTDQERMLAEKARIALYDGSNVADLLNRTVNFLHDLDIQLTQSGNAGQKYTVTTIIDHTGNPYTLKFLVDLLKINPNKIYFKYDPNNPVDVEIYLGLDWARQNSLP